MNTLNIPKVIFGTSAIGNLYTILPDDVKQAIVEEYLKMSDVYSKPFFDTAGKYGAGLALESLGKCLTQSNVLPDEVVISNKLGWIRVPLQADTPDVDAGLWKGIKHSVAPRISYDGILECYEQGNQLLGNYEARFVSVHDPDEYLMSAIGQGQKEQYFQDIIAAYAALTDLKRSGTVDAVGVASKDWRSIELIIDHVKLDWVMIANSMTIHRHPKEIIDFMKKLKRQGITIINSAVFNGGFLAGGEYYNYKLVDEESAEGRAIYQWRADFRKVCDLFGLSPAAVCIKFGISAPGVAGIALGATAAHHVRSGFDMVNINIPEAFWMRLASQNLISEEALELVLNKITN